MLPRIKIDDQTIKIEVPSLNEGAKLATPKNYRKTECLKVGKHFFAFFTLTEKAIFEIVDKHLEKLPPEHKVVKRPEYAYTDTYLRIRVEFIPTNVDYKFTYDGLTYYIGIAYNEKSGNNYVKGKPFLFESTSGACFTPGGNNAYVELSSKSKAEKFVHFMNHFFSELEKKHENVKKLVTEKYSDMKKLRAKEANLIYLPLF
jgi:hypothetical protein